MNQVNRKNAIRQFVACCTVLLLAACGEQHDATPHSAAATDASLKVPITTSSDSARELYMQGRSLLDDLHFVEANDVFLQSVEADPTFAMGHFMVATTSQTAAEFFDAIANADANASAASEGEQLYIRALVAASENDQAAQREALNQLVAKYPSDERAHTQLGNFINGQQDFAGAVEHFRRATELNPEFATAYNSLGYAYRSLDDLDNAKAAFGKYVELVPDEANPYDSYAELLMEMGSYDESIENYRKALAINPNFAASYAGISTNESLKGNPELAQEAADQMLAAARNLAERQAAMFQSAIAHLFAGDTDAAMEVCNTMLAEAEVKGNHAAMGGIHEYMGDAMNTAGDTAKAKEHFAAALEHRQKADINDANKALAGRTHDFKVAIAEMIAGNLDAAAAKAAEYSAAAESSGTTFEKRRIHELAGYLAMFSGDVAASTEHLAQANQLDPLVLYWSAVANAELGNADQARELATRAASRNTLSANLPFVRTDALELLENLNAG